MERNPISLAIRGVQALFGIIVLGLTAYKLTSFSNTVASEGSLDSSNFLLFCGLWTAFIVVPYMLLAPTYAPVAAHPFAIIGVDGVTMIFWFAGFIALGSKLPPPRFCTFNACRVLQAATVFGSFEWVLFVATLALAVLPVVRNRGTPKPNENVPQPSI
ncbi:conserved hypothetical protein [Coccidioides posadasii str. Silveira]|uniref:MARVEL domain-containing protein n=2 Tax=Coccidioides posadasii TaxID=199306 RepID=E9CT62_COCPS|nr:conserved hypothetical protein [Coccidioides posadasii str. Silveira]KMM67330.1 hypothetical protein CPAG_03665 [Coccidioides posadasii RMSCC 3488]